MWRGKNLHFYPAKASRRKEKQFQRGKRRLSAGKGVRQVLFFWRKSHALFWGGGKAHVEINDENFFSGISHMPPPPFLV